MDGEKRYTHRLDGETGDMLKALCKEHQRNGSQMVRWLIRVAYSVLDVGARSSDVRHAFVSRSPDVIPVTNEGRTNEIGTEVALQSTQNKKEKREKREKKPSSHLVSTEFADRVLGHLNKKAGTNYQARGKKTRELMQARVNEGAAEKDFYTVIDNMVPEWLGSKVEHCLRPKTLFGTSFWDYCGALDPKTRSKRSNGDSNGKQTELAAGWNRKREMQPHERREQEEKQRNLATPEEVARVAEELSKAD